MRVSVDQVIAWLIIAALAGGLAGFLVKRKKEGYGRFQNVLIGLAGTLIGVGLLRLLEQVNILEQPIIKGGVTIQWQDLAAACIGALLFLLVLHFFRKKKSSS